MKNENKERTLNEEAKVMEPALRFMVVYPKVQAMHFLHRWFPYDVVREYEMDMEEDGTVEHWEKFVDGEGPIDNAKLFEDFRQWLLDYGETKNDVVSLFCVSYYDDVYRRVHARRQYDRLVAAGLEGRLAIDEEIALLR